MDLFGFGRFLVCTLLVLMSFCKVLVGSRRFLVGFGRFSKFVHCFWLDLLGFGRFLVGFGRFFMFLVGFGLLQAVCGRLPAVPSPPGRLEKFRAPPS